MSFLKQHTFSIKKTNPFFQPMCIVGPGYKCRTYKELQGPILQAEKNYVNIGLKDFK